MAQGTGVARGSDLAQGAERAQVALFAQGQEAFGLVAIEAARPAEDENEGEGREAA
jgi:hypothetical protein